MTTLRYAWLTDHDAAGAAGGLPALRGGPCPAPRPPGAPGPARPRRREEATSRGGRGLSPGIFVSLPLQYISLSSGC